MLAMRMYRIRTRMCSSRNLKNHLNHPRFETLTDAHPREEPTDMTSKPSDTKHESKDKHPGMMGDGTEEQNLNQKGNPDARIKKDEVADAFSKDKAKR